MTGPLLSQGRIDVLVNCAAIDAKFDSSGAGTEKPWVENFPEDIWRKSLDVNVTGTFLVTKYVLRHMLARQSGNIINIGSVYGLVSPDQTLYGDPSDADFQPKPVDYVATKSFVPNFTRYLATTYARRGMRCSGA